MGSVFSSVWQMFFAGNQPLKIVMVGLANAGKSTILYQMHLGEVIETTPTIGSNVEEVKHGALKLKIWDLGGQESLRKTWATYFVDAHGVVLVVDCSDRAHAGTVKSELERLLANEDVRNAAVLILANKQDKAGSMSASELSASLGLHNISDRPWHINACCALTKEGLTEGFDWLAQNIKR